MRIAMNKCGETVIVSLSGYLYIESVKKLYENCKRYIDNDKASFVFNLGELKYFDSSGLAALIIMQNEVHAYGGTVIFKEVRGIVREVFDITRSSEIFKIE